MAASAVDPCKRRVGDRDRVVALGGVEHIGTPSAFQRVVTGTGDNRLGGGCAGECLVIGCPFERDCSDAVAAVEHIGGAGVADAIRVGLGSTDQNIGIAVAVDVTGCGDRSARLVDVAGPVKHHAVAAGQCREIQDRRGSGGHRCAKHQVGLSGADRTVGTGRVGTDQHVVKAVPVDVPGT